MSVAKYLLYLLVMAGVTYLIRMLPLAVFRQKFENKFIRSFLYYVPYAVLASMTFPSAFYATGNVATAAIGVAVAVILAWFNKGLVTVALASCAACFLAGLIF